MGQRDIGKQIAKLLFPEFQPEPDGSVNDLNGIDGNLNGRTVQVKYNHRIIVSGNLYHEIYEKTDRRPSQPWRTSLAKVDDYLFITENNLEYIGYLASLNELASKEANKQLRAINPNDGDKTSIGFLIQLYSVKNVERHYPKANRLM